MAGFAPQTCRPFGKPQEDELETQLITATNTRRALLEATLHDALTAGPGQWASENAAGNIRYSLQ